MVQKGNLFVILKLKDNDIDSKYRQVKTGGWILGLIEEDEMEVM